MVSEFRKYRTELKEALKWPPPPQRKKREEKLVMSWSLCDCLSADVTQLYTRARFSRAANHCSAARNQPQNLLHTPASETPPRQHTPIPPWMSEEKKKQNHPFPPIPPPAPSKPQSRAEGKARRRSATSVPPHRLCCDRAARPPAPRRRCQIKRHRKVALPPTKKGDYHKINK